MLRITKLGNIKNKNHHYETLTSVLMFFLFIGTTNAQKIMGFTDSNAAKQLDWEKQFDAQLKASNQDDWMSS
jgi:hypothetical protein